MPPTSGSYSYLLREPAGISTRTRTSSLDPVLTMAANIEEPRWRKAHAASTEPVSLVSMNVNGSRPLLVLWDVDGTLVDSAGLGREAFMEAFERVTGSLPSAQVPFAGRTDLEIALDMLLVSGVEAGEELLRLFGAAL